MKLKFKVLVLVFGVLSFFINVLPAHALVLNVFRDGYVDDFEPSGVLDGNPDRLSDTNALLAGKLLLSNGIAIESRAVMTFDINSLAGKTLTSAYLTGYGTRVDAFGLPDTIDADLSIYEGDGLVGLDDFNASSTFISVMTFGPNTFGPPDFTLKLNPFQVDVKNFLQPYLNNPTNFVEFKLVSNSFTAFVNAGEATEPGRTIDTRWPGPQLVLEFQDTEVPPSTVPEPATLSLLSIGFLSLAKIRKSKFLS